MKSCALEPAEQEAFADAATLAAQWPVKVPELRHMVQAAKDEAAVVRLDSGLEVSALAPAGR